MNNYKNTGIDKNLMEVLNRKFSMTDEDLTFIEEHENVQEFNFLGLSGEIIQGHWYNVVLINGEEYDIYTGYFKKD